MKKIIMLFVSALCLAGCSESDLVESIIKPEKLSGEWVYDHPEEGVWETMKFTESGVFYYSNDVATWNINNDRNDGRYSVSGDHGEYLHGSYTENGQPMEVNMTFSVLNDYSFTATFAETGLTFTYSRLLTTQRLKQGETVTPNYQSLVSAEINWYRSHDTSIATVDTYSGEITGVAVSGRTYIDVVTTKGTAVVEVLVSDPENLFDDYTWAFGKTLSELKQQLGNKYLVEEEAGGIAYMSKNLIVTKETYMTGIEDNTHIQYVQLELNGSVTSTQIKNYLDTKYYYQSTDENGVHTYYDTDDIFQLNYSVYYDPTNATVSFARWITPDQWAELTSFFGLTQEDIKSKAEQKLLVFLFDTRDFSLDGTSAFYVNDGGWVNMVNFYFNEQKHMSEYWLYIDPSNSQATYQHCFNQLRLLRYVYSEQESTATKAVFYNNNKTIRVDYCHEDGYMAFVSLEEDTYRETLIPFLTEAFGMTKEEVKDLFVFHTLTLETESQLRYAYERTEYAYIYGGYLMFNSEGKVNQVVARIWEDAPVNVIEDYLNSIYVFHSDHGDYKQWTDNKDFSKATVGILYSPAEYYISFVPLNNASARMTWMSRKPVFD